LGVYYLIKFIIISVQYFYAYSIVGEYGSEMEQIFNWVTMSWGLIYLAVIWVMLVFPVTLAQWFVPRKVNEDDSENIHISNLIISAFVIIGVVLLARSIPDIFYNCAWIWHIYSAEMNTHLLSEYVIDLLTTFIEFGIGLYLTIGTRGFRRILFKIRRAGIQ